MGFKTYVKNNNNNTKNGGIWKGHILKGEKGERRDGDRKQSNMTDLKLTMSIIILNINGPNIPLRRYPQVV